MRLFFTLFTLIMYIINEIFILKNERIMKKGENEKNEFKKIKKWEMISNIIVIFSLLIIFIIFIFKFKWLATVWSIIYYGVCGLIYSLALFNILLKNKEDNVSNVELRALMLIPFVIVAGYYLFGSKIEALTSVTIEVFIIKNVFRYLVYIFFTLIYVFIFLMQIKQFIEYKNRNKQNVPKHDIKYNIIDYEYVNAKGKKGILFLLGYIKDIMKLLFIIIVSGLNNLWNIIVFSFLVLRKFIMKITGNLSMYVIIIKTFNISLIISLLLTYNRILTNYENNNIVEMYSIIITVIIIPSIMEIISDLKK